MKEKYQTELLGAIHETSVGLHRIGVIDDREMKEYDEECLVQNLKTIDKSTSPARTGHASRVTRPV
jgi:DNA-binding transcriptional regulator YiaG